MHLKKSKSKGIAIDMVPIRRSSELLGTMNMVFFSPEDLSIIKNSPAERRNFMDMELCQLDKIYVSLLANYKKVLDQRNNLLKQIRFQNNLIETLEAWDIQLVKYGSEVIKYREKFIKHLGEVCQKIHNKLTGGKEKILLEYDRDVGYDSYLTELAKKRQKDLKYSTTTVGPHRDDISFIVNGIDIRKYGSQGQQRTAALSLKLAQIQLMREVMKESPILLLDDVLSELDSNRKTYLLESIKDTQTIITCTGLDEFISKHLPIQRMFQIKAGKIVKEN